MSTTKARRLRAGLISGATAILLVHILQWLLPDAAGIWNHRIIDRLFQFRAASSSYQPPYNDVVVHVDINQTTLQRLNRRHLTREHHARGIASLAAMATRAQLYDFVFASERSPREDDLLVAAAREAGNVFFGLVLLFETIDRQREASPNGISSKDLLKAARWNVRFPDSFDAVPVARDAIITFPELASVSQGLGALNLRYDQDGVYRRYPLLFRYDNRAYPSIVLLTVCHYLGVAPDTVTLDPDRWLILPAARFPGASDPRDVRIPLDSSGNMIIDFIGPWERMRHYNFADILRALENPVETALWREELGDRIVVVSEVLSGASDAGPVPTDTHYPLSGVHANALHTILTESFFQPAPAAFQLTAELLLTALAVSAFAYLPATGFGAVILLSTLGYSSLAAAAFLHSRWLWDFLSPNGILLALLLVFLVHRVVESTRVSVEAQRERDLVEKELEIGRRIQADFFPSQLPAIRGWELAATIHPARQVAGDFYDLFTLNGKRSIAVLLGDVCDKGVGAAMFMALFRSLIRALCQQQVEQGTLTGEAATSWAPALLQRTVQQTNDYIAVVHEKACMFATLFFAIVDVQTGKMHYVNCGHEPPLVLGAGGHIHRLKPTGPAVGTFSGAQFGWRALRLVRGDLLFACTDGVYETPDPQNRPFSHERLVAILEAPHASLSAMLEAIQTAIDRHQQSAHPFDDITMVALGFKGSEGAKAI